MATPTQPYDRDHQLTRERLLPDAYGTPCPRCGRPMLRGQRLELGHTVDAATDPSSRGDRIEHADYADCPEGGNRSAGGKLGAERTKLKPSRAW